MQGAIKEYCHSCRREARLVYIGEQTWPLQVANRMGIRPVVTLWRCTICQTTITIPADR